MSRRQFTQADVDAFNARMAAAKAPPQTTGWPPPTAAKAAPRESVIQEQIANYLRRFGHQCAFDVQRMDKPTTGTVGRPDFLGGLRAVGFAMEVKRPGQKETREQAGELLRWQLAGFKVAVVHSIEEAVAFVTTQVIP